MKKENFLGGLDTFKGKALNPGAITGAVLAAPSEKEINPKAIVKLLT